MTTENAHHDISTNEYKIFKLSNSSGDYYVSYTRQKYLTRVVENFKRKKTDTFTKLFNGNNIKIELLEIVNSENIYFIKNKINDYITKEDQKHNVKNKEQVEQTKQEQVEQEQTKQEQVKQVEQVQVEQEQVEQVEQEQTKQEQVKQEQVKQVEQVQVEQEQVEQETDKKLIECKVCNCKVSYTNFARHRQSKKHLRKMCD
jgi:hypothetical protein